MMKFDRAAVKVDGRTQRHTAIFADGGLPEVVQWVAATPRSWHDQASVNENSSKRWDMNTDWNASLEMAKTGWSEGALDLASRIAVAAPSATREAAWRFDVAGERPDVGRYCAGNPMAMRRKGKRDGSAPIVSLLVGIGGNCIVTAQQLADYGAALCGIIDRIEAGGRRCEIVAMASFQTRDGRAAVGWRVKNAGDALDMAALAFSIAHPAAFRRIGFALMERLPRAQEDVGYGSARAGVAEDWPDAPANVIVLPNIGPGECKNGVAEALESASTRINDAWTAQGHPDPLVTLE